MESPSGTLHCPFDVYIKNPPGVDLDHLHQVFIGKMLGKPLGWGPAPQ